MCADKTIQLLDVPLLGKGPSWMNAPLTHDPLSREPPMITPHDAQESPFAWIGDLVAFLRRHRRLVMRCVACALTLAVLYLLTATPKFTADATLLVDTRQSQLFSQAPSVSDAQIENAIIESQVEVLRSAGLARRVVSDLKLASDPSFSGHPTLLGRLTASLRSIGSSTGRGGASTAAQDRLVQSFLSSVSARRVGLTYVIEVDATATDPALAAKLANGLISAYLAEQLTVKENSLQQASGWLETRLSELQGKALKADEDVQAFKSRNGIVDTGKGLLNEQQLSELNSQLVAARGRTADAQARLDRITQTMHSATGPEATADLLKSPVINGLRERYLADAAKVAEWSVRFGPDHGAVVNLRKEMVGLQQSIDSEMRQIEQAAESDLKIGQTTQAALQAQLGTLSEQSASTDTSRAMLRSLQSAADTYRSLYVSFLQRAMQTAQDVSSPVGDAHVVTEARPPLAKSAPKTKLVLAGALLLGLAAAFAIGLFREALDQRLRTAADVRSRTGLGFLASLPTVHGAGSSLARFAADHPDSAFGLGVRRLQRRIVQQCDSGRGKVVGMIAPAASAGVSTVAANLVASLIRSGHGVAALDLSHSTEARPVIRTRIEALRREHDVVIVDLPPLSRPEEAHSAIADVDALALVMRAGTLDGASLLESLREAGLDRTSLLGVVINRADPAG
jgi:succinoglycan biosynthesis transport protein ExoP